MPSSVVIERQTSAGVVYWTGGDWSGDKSEARLFQDATSCPRSLRLGGASRAVRRLNRYWAGSICWATVVDAALELGEGAGHASGGQDG